MGDRTGALIDRARAVTLAAAPPAAVAFAHHSILDWLGCAVAGAGEPLVAVLDAELGAAAGPCSFVAGAGRAGAVDAALRNGAAGHALDFDDTNLAMGGHPSAPVVPAVLALAERAGASGADVVAAVVAGFEAQCRVGQLVNPGHYAVGFHTTGTVGTFGAAAACAHLLGLDAGQWRHALGLAGSQAAGVKAAFGTMTKPFHAGRAAANGVLAAVLASRGFTSSESTLDDPQGFVHTHHGDGEGLGDEAQWYTCETLFKVHAACHLTHAAIEATLRLRDAYDVRADDVESIVVEVHPTCMGVCNIPAPSTGLEAKFSLRGTVAMALLGRDTTDPASYNDDLVAGADYVGLRGRTTVDPVVRGSSTRSTVRVRRHDGTEVAETVDVGVPSTDLDAQQRLLVAKCRGLVAPVLGAGGAERLVAAALGASGLARAADLLAATRP